MNINFPTASPTRWSGVSVTSQGRRDPGLLHIDERQDTWGNPYYWLAFERRRSVAPRRAPTCGRSMPGGSPSRRSTWI